MTAALAELKSRWTRLPWRFVLLASYVGVNLALIPQKIQLGPDVGVDWQIMRALPEAIGSGTVYELEVDGVRFAWSPVMAWLMAAVATIGYWPWVAAHVAAVFLLRRPLLIGLLLVSYGFWFDAAEGNTVVFLVVAAIASLHGSRLGRLAFLALVLLAPRPLAIPLTMWLLWTDRSLWRPFAALFAVHAGLVVASGDLLPWVQTMLATDLAHGITIGPTAWFGRWWVVVGIPLGIWLAARGHPGWAGLAVSPYVTPQYVLWPLIEIDSSPERRRAREHAGAQEPIRRPPDAAR